MHGCLYMSDQNQLTDALRKARLAQAAQLDSILALRDARAIRLETIRAELSVQLKADPNACALFDLILLPGEAPKLWIDLISSIVMEPDPATYRLVQDHESRRTVLFESRDLDEMVQFAVKYMAHRLVTHEKIASEAGMRLIDSPKGYSAWELVYVWITGCTFGVLGLLIAAILLGKLNF